MDSKKLANIQYDLVEEIFLIGGFEHYGGSYQRKIGYFLSNNNLAHKIVKVFLKILINFNIQFLHVLNEKDPVENTMYKLSCYKKMFATYT